MARISVGPKPSRSDAGSNPDKTKNQFEDLVVSASGTIPNYKHDAIQKLVEECGAKFEKMDISECTHLITTAGCYHSKAVPTKITEAQRNEDCMIVSIDWLLASSKAKKPLAANAFLIRALGSKRPIETTSDSVSNPTHKRKLSTDSSEGTDRRTKGGNDRVLANFDKLSALVDKEIPAEGRKGPAVWIDEGGAIWDATLVESLSTLNEITKLATPSAKIIRIQLIIDTQLDTYNTFIRETSLDQNSTVVCMGNGHFSRAIAGFKTAFKGFTGLAWSERHKQAKKGKAIFIQLETKDHQDKPDSEVCSVLSKFVNLANLPAVKTLLLKSYPNKLLEKDEKSSEHSRLTAISLLDKILDLQAENRNKSGTNDAHSLKASFSQCFFKLFWQGTPLPTKTDWISESRRLIQGLRSFNAIEDAAKDLSQTDPALLRHVLGLLHLEAMTTVRKKAGEYKKLADYFKKSSGKCSVTLLHIFRIERHGEAERFSKWREDHKAILSERRLLWHGSPVANFASILQKGFRHAPGGIFFADWAEKSVGFCRVAPGQEAFMLLCEVEFGQQGGAFGGGRNGNSYLIDGLSHKSWRDAASVHPDLKGVQIPDVRPQPAGYHFLREYIIMDPVQIRLRYIFHFKVKNYN